MSLQKSQPNTKESYKRGKSDRITRMHKEAILKNDNDKSFSTSNYFKYSLNSPIKRHKVVEWKKTNKHTTLCYL